MTNRLTIEYGRLYLADLSPRIGTEPGKIRPVLVVQTDFLNATGHPSTWILPCTTKLAKENLLRVPIPAGLAGNAQSCEIMVEPKPRNRQPPLSTPTCPLASAPHARGQGKTAKTGRIVAPGLLRMETAQAVMAGVTGFVQSRVPSPIQQRWRSPILVFS